MSETFTFDVSYDTTFEDLETLRETMLRFIKTHRRDYQPSFDVVVKGAFILRFVDISGLTRSAVFSMTFRFSRPGENDTGN